MANEMETLLQKAKEFKVKNRRENSFSDEDMELAIAWIKNEITAKQVGNAWSMKIPTSITYRLANTLRFAYMRGKITIN